MVPERNEEDTTDSQEKINEEDLSQVGQKREIMGKIQNTKVQICRTRFETRETGTGRL